MEIREFARRILLSSELELKLVRVRSAWTDEHPGEPLRVHRPARPHNLQFAPRRTAPAMPKPHAFTDPSRRAIAHHIMANHELQALEVMAFVLLAFPDAPGEFRRGLMDVMADEQRHTRMHTERAAVLGVPFGNLPINGYIWNKAQVFESVLDYLAGLPLTFEGRNLDHTSEFETNFRTAGDEKSATIMRVIHNDEIRHVAFGIKWLRKLKLHDQSDFDAYCAHLHWPLRPARSRGDCFNRHARLAAGLSPEFIDAVEASGEGNPTSRQ